MVRREGGNQGLPYPSRRAVIHDDAEIISRVLRGHIGWRKPVGIVHRSLRAAAVRAPRKRRQRFALESEGNKSQ